MNSRAQNRAVVRKKQLRNTYITTLVMLLMGTMQVWVTLQSASILKFLEENFYIFMVVYFVSFLSLQIYVFLFHNMNEKYKIRRNLLAIWTYEINTIVPIQTIESPSKMCFLGATGFIIMIMGVGAIYGGCSVSHNRGLFMPRKNLIRMSEIYYAFTMFVLIAIPQMKKIYIQLSAIIVAIVMLNIFILSFTSSIFRLNFFYINRSYDYMLIGHLYYLQLYALYMSYAMAIADFENVFQ